MTNVITMAGEKARTPADVIHELNELVASGEVKSLMIVVTRVNNERSVDWSYQSMGDLSYSVHVAHHNMMLQLDRTMIDHG